jgi:hypothetical protein
MELTHNGYAIPARQLDPREAAGALMGKRYLVFLGVRAVACRRWLLSELAIAFPGQCTVLCSQARWQWTPDRVQKCLICPAIDKGAATPLRWRWELAPGN